MNTITIEEWTNSFFQDKRIQYSGSTYRIMEFDRSWNLKYYTFTLYSKEHSVFAYLKVVSENGSVIEERFKRS
jgi:hypothetical protein